MSGKTERTELEMDQEETLLLSELGLETWDQIPEEETKQDETRTGKRKANEIEDEDAVLEEAQARRVLLKAERRLLLKQCEAPAEERALCLHRRIPSISSTYPLSYFSRYGLTLTCGHCHAVVPGIQLRTNTLLALCGPCWQSYVELELQQLNWPCPQRRFVMPLGSSCLQSFLG